VLPAFDVPADSDARPLPSVLFPAPVKAEASAARTWSPVPLILVRDGLPRPATTLRGALTELGRWADGATSRWLEGLSAAIREEEVLVRGERLPPVVGAERFWGSRVLVPLGFRPEPALAESVLAAALGLSADELAVLGEDEVEVVLGLSFGPLTRAGLRRALGEAP
jgi:hypothetical protein